MQLFSCKPGNPLFWFLAAALSHTPHAVLLQRLPASTRCKVDLTFKNETDILKPRSFHVTPKEPTIQKRIAGVALALVKSSPRELSGRRGVRRGGETLSSIIFHRLCCQVRQNLCQRAEGKEVERDEGREWTDWRGVPAGQETPLIGGGHFPRNDWRANAYGQPGKHASSRPISRKVCAVLE